jgi:hypothetical protein
MTDGSGVVENKFRASQHMKLPENRSEDQGKLYTKEPRTAP